MREIRIYQIGLYTPGEIIELSAEASQHVGVVLRMQAGDPLILFNGENQEFKGIIHQVKKRKIEVLIESTEIVNKESPVAIHLAQAISKGDRMEFVMQKAVELGVASIAPLITERCAVKLDQSRLEKKIKQWQAIAIAACEQCGRNVVPLIHNTLPFQQYFSNSKQITQAKFVLDPYQGKSWRQYDLNCSSITLLIGPEGGFSAAEVQLAIEQGFKPLSLGPRILRTETAAISAISLLQGVVGDL